MPRVARTFIILCTVLVSGFVAGPSATVAAQPHPCTRAQQRAITRVVSHFSRALIRNDMTTVNRIITPALQARTHATWVQRSIHPKTEQAALSLMLVGPDHNGTPVKPVSFRFLADRCLSFGTRSLRASIELFYYWPGAALSVVTLVKTTQGWRISGLGLAQV